MKLKLKITGPKVYDVFLEAFLIDLALNSEIMKFGVFAYVEDGVEAVTAKMDAEEECIESFQRALEEKEPPKGAQISSIQFEPCEGRVPSIGLTSIINCCVMLDRMVRNLNSNNESLPADQNQTELGRRLAR